MQWSGSNTTTYTYSHPVTSTLSANVTLNASSCALAFLSVRGAGRSTHSFGGWEQPHLL